MDLPEDCPKIQDDCHTNSKDVQDVQDVQGPISCGHDVPMKSSFPVPVDQPIHDGRKMLVLLKTTQCVQFKTLMESLKELLTEVNMEFIEGAGVKLVSIDPGCVAMIHLEINAVEYFFAKGKVTAGISILLLYRIIRSLTSGDYMEWRIYEDEPHSMYVEFSNNERRTNTINKIKLLDLDEMSIHIPHVEFDRVVSMPSSEFSKHVKEMTNISKLITIRATKNTLEFVAEGDMATIHITVQPTASGLNWKHSEDSMEDIEGKFIVKYLDKFCKCNVNNNVELFLKNDFPLVFRYELSIGTLRFCIAPVKDEE